MRNTHTHTHNHSLMHPPTHPRPTRTESRHHAMRNPAHTRTHTHKNHGTSMRPHVEARLHIQRGGVGGASRSPPTYRGERGRGDRRGWKEGETERETQTQTQTQAQGQAHKHSLTDITVKPVEDGREEGAADEDRDAGVIEEEEEVAHGQRVAIEKVIGC